MSYDSIIEDSETNLSQQNSINYFTHTTIPGRIQNFSNKSANLKLLATWRHKQQLERQCNCY